MPRYIDADELKKQVDLVQVLVMGGRCQGKTLLNETMEIYKKGIFKKIDEQPTADVVPKSESLPLDVHEALKQRAVEKAKVEVAMEIFAEIEKWLVHEYVPYIRGYSNSLARNFAELKKKYTEGENNGSITKS